MIKFEWDNEKAAANEIKHGVTFEIAARVFFDENRIEYYDEEHSGTEDRYYTIGMAGNVLFVVYTERQEAIRLISARLATKSEEAAYYDHLYSGR